MLECIRNFKTCELLLREPARPLEQEWLITRLMSKHGVREARFHQDEPGRLMVEYDADAIGALGLLDFLDVCGACADPAPPRPGRRAAGRRPGAGSGTRAA